MQCDHLKHNSGIIPAQCTGCTGIARYDNGELESQVIDPYKAIWLVLDVIKIIEHNHNNVYQPHNCFIVLQPQHAGLQAARLSGTVLTPHQSHDLHHHHHPPMSIIILEWKPPYYIPWLLLREERLKSEEYLYINTL